MTQEQALLEAGMVEQVQVLETSLQNLLILLGKRIDISSQGEGYYWDNCREVVVRIRNEVHKLPGWLAK